MCALRIFESEWNGLKLADVAAAVGGGSAAAPADFYAAFYRQLEAADYRLDPGWVAKKGGETRCMQRHLETAERDLGRRAHAVSVGAGLGLVEAPLIAAGHNIMLQECQPESFAYIKRRGLDFRGYVGAIENIPERPFDIAFAFSVSYAVPPDCYVGFLAAIARILRPGGRLVMWDPAPSWRNLPGVKALADLARRRRSLFWGWLRTPREHARTLQRAGLAVEGVWLARPGDSDPGLFINCSRKTGLCRPGLVQWLVARRAPAQGPHPQ